MISATTIDAAEPLAIDATTKPEQAEADENEQQDVQVLDDPRRHERGERGIEKAREEALAGRRERCGCGAHLAERYAPHRMA